MLIFSCELNEKKFTLFFVYYIYYILINVKLAEQIFYFDIFQNPIINFKLNG